MDDVQINEAVVLAAVQRAERHRKPGAPSGVAVWTVREHVGVAARSRAGRAVRATLLALEGKGVRRGRRHGVLTWELTAAGRRRLSRLRERGELPMLVESPQHRAWREAHALAERRVEAFRLALREGAQYTVALMEQPASAAQPGSDVVFEIGERLQRVCWQLASALYCLHEWREPDDTHADIDDHTSPHDREVSDPRERKKRRSRRAGRRNVRQWEEPPLLAFVGNAIRHHRELRRLTAGELAAKVEIDPAALERVEAGLLDPRLCAARPARESPRHPGRHPHQARRHR